MRHLPDSSRQAIARLTPAQLDVMRLVQRRLTTKEIASELSISASAVDARIKSVLARLGVLRRSEAAALLDAYDLANTTSPSQPTPPEIWLQSPELSPAPTDLASPAQPDAPFGAAMPPPALNEPTVIGFAHQGEWPLPFERAGRKNRPSTVQRLLWTFVVAVAGPLLFTNLIAAGRAAREFYRALVTG